MKAVIALGSNVGDTLANLREAIKRLQAEGCHILSLSRLYETSPVGYADQDNFLNGAALIETSFSPVELLALCKKIENDMGRVKMIVNGPRNIDLDILLYGQEQIEEEDLTIPHPRLHKRLFVLKPLMDIAPDMIVPSRGVVRALYDAYDGNESVHLAKVKL